MENYNIFKKWLQLKGGNSTVTEEEAKVITEKLIDDTEIILKEINRELNRRLGAI